LSNPEYVKVDNKLYKINTDFRVALECDRIARDNNIGDYERFLAIIYKLFGDDGLECKNQNKLLELGLKYITLGKEQKGLKNDFESKYQLDFNKCKGLIRSSFKFDYNYDPYNMEYLHWYDFYNDLENLSTSEFGTCCILNRIQSILNTDVKNIKDTKERTKINEAKILLKERYCIDEKVKMTKEQEKSAEKFYKALGLI
jgi:hypothetical protein